MENILIIRRLLSTYWSDNIVWMRLTENSRPGKLVISEEGVKAREKVWAEISEILRGAAPEVGGILSGNFELS
jgi:hypothetical protein